MHTTLDIGFITKRRRHPKIKFDWTYVEKRKWSRASKKVAHDGLSGIDDVRRCSRHAVSDRWKATV